MTDKNLVSPSGVPRVIPSDENGIPVSLNYMLSGGGDAVPAGNYAESLLRASGVAYGVDGRVNSLPIRNVGQYTEAVLCLDVHAMVRDDSDETLNVAIETSFDAGKHWKRIAGFNTVETAGKSTQVMKISPSGVGEQSIWTNLDVPSDDSDVTPIGSIDFYAFGDLMRTSSLFVDAAGADSSGIFSVYGSFKR